MRDKRLKEETLSSKLREHVEAADATAALENVEATKAAMPRQVKCSQVDAASSRRATQRARHPLSHALAYRRTHHSPRQDLFLAPFNVTREKLPLMHHSRFVLELPKGVLVD